MPADAYGKTVGGRLQLKGGVALKTKHKKKHKSKKRERDEDDGDVTATRKQEEFKIEKRKGSGRILSSGTTVMGQLGTKFLQELHNGDAIIIKHPTTLVEETRIIRVVLSDVSCSISSAFSSDLVSSTPFQFIRAPPEEEDEQEKEKKKKRKRTADEAAAFGTYAGGTEAGTTFAYRVKKGGAYGGYAIVTERADSDRSREELLDMRAKKKGDRHCM
ncbi:hypothetical protein Poli38472_008142 [Pythium oligandrum]|uniref:Uncharacterized protein n=1 Tax=Pythium oligandrum TaxID=41045 RepID=A0A8K1CLK9_PYTOL|nr:hypothetical protein Poli38472_008142 [Pythium oligandrum]|eukprot:TMW65500.1 hypothetical protein Poli38472_008142 [Pythium oligandrum]